jgi:hypothetical protein
MITLVKTYGTATEARGAVAALRALAVPDRDLRLLVGHPAGDLREEPLGGFAGPVLPEDPVGTYGGEPIARRRAAGGFAGDPDVQRQGSFANTDRVVIVTFAGDAERTRVTGLHGARRLLRRTTLEDEAVDRATRELHSGHAVILVDVDEAGAVAHAA